MRCVHFPHAIRLPLPRGMPAALERAARHQITSPAEYARQTLLRGLAADGVRLNDGRVEVLDAEDEQPRQAV